MSQKQNPTEEQIKGIRRTFVAQIKAVTPKKRELAEDGAEVETEIEGDAPGLENDTPVALTFEASLSSELPVKRYDWYADQTYNEVLVHSAEALDLTRAMNGLPLCVNHSTYNQIGIVENIKLEGTKTVGTLRFSRNEEGQAYARDVQDGIRKDLSIGYSIDKYEMDETTTPPTLRATSWVIYEVSIATVPADYTVGIGRTKDDDTFSEFLKGKRTAEKANDKLTNSESVYPKIETTNPQKRSTEMSQNTQPTQTLDFARLRELGASDAQVATFAERGMDTGAAMAEMLKQRTAAPAASLAGLSTTDKQAVARSFSYARAIALAAEGRSLDGVEAEVHQELLAKQGPNKSERGGIQVPLSLRTALGNVTSTSSVPNDPAFLASGTNGEVIEAIRNQSRALTMGASLYTGLTGELKIPKYSGDDEAHWVTENPANDYADNTLSAPSLVTLRPKLLASNHKTTIQLLNLSGPFYNPEQQIREAIGFAVAKAIDKAAFRGTGTEQPTGIMNAAGVGVHDFENVGPSYSDIMSIVTKLRVDMKQSGVVKFATAAEVAGYLMQVLTNNTTAAAQYLWQGTHDEGKLCGYYATTADNLGMLGTGGDEYSFIAGLWENLAIGLGGSTEIVVDPYSNKKRGVVEFTSYTFADSVIKRAEAFVIGSRLKLA